MSTRDQRQVVIDRAVDAVRPVVLSTITGEDWRRMFRRERGLAKPVNNVAQEIRLRLEVVG